MTATAVAPLTDTDPWEGVDVLAPNPLDAVRVCMEAGHDIRAFPAETSGLHDVGCAGKYDVGFPSCGRWAYGVPVALVLPSERVAA